MALYMEHFSVYLPTFTLCGIIERVHVSLETSDRLGDSINRGSNHYHEAAL